MLTSRGPVDLVHLFQRELELCKVTEGENVAVLTQGGERNDYAEAFVVAATECNASAYLIDLPGSALQAAQERHPNPLANSRIVVEALKGSDLVIDLIGLLWSKEQGEIEAAGTRILMCIGKVDSLVRMFPTSAQKQRILNSEQLLKNSTQLRITSDHGTDLRYQIGSHPVLTQYGFVDYPGAWDHFVSTLVAVVANDGAVEGRVVLVPGDIAFFGIPGRYITEQVEFRIDGEIKEILGGSEATIIRDYMKSYDDKRAYEISHVGWGLNENAQWNSLALGNPGDARSVEGSVMFSTGPNSEFGGDNDTACHLDFPMQREHTSLFLDDRLVIDHGRIVPEV